MFPSSCEIQLALLRKYAQNRAPIHVQTVCYVGDEQLETWRNAEMESLEITVMQQNAEMQIKPKPLSASFRHTLHNHQRHNHMHYEIGYSG